MEPGTLWAVLANLHYKVITPLEARILSLLAQGYSNDEIAVLVNQTAGTIRRHVADLCHRVFETTEVPQSREKLKAWIDPHRVCCIPLVQEMIENDRKIA
jgi:DNA-binding CsgD family transcriptional regulator